MVSSRETVPSSQAVDGMPWGACWLLLPVAPSEEQAYREPRLRSCPECRRHCTLEQGRTGICTLGGHEATRKALSHNIKIPQKDTSTTKKNE